MTALCKRLTTEFMHYVIEARALRKVFCSIKGYYFQAEIKGQTVTWIIPHSFGFNQPASVDMRLMSIFVEFYTTVLGFVNFRLYHSLNMTYPPKLASAIEVSTDADDRVAALNQALARTVEEPVDQMDIISTGESDESMEKARLEAEARERQAKLFEGLRFFLGREVPREPLVFMIRALGGEVSWDSSVAPGATFAEEDDKVTHQISDRNAVNNKVLGRFYVQPQWVFDSLNKRLRCKEADYALGETLPPHLSPFIGERRVGDYVPPEEKNEEDKVMDDEEKDSSKVENMGVREGVMDKLDDDHEKKMQEDEEYRLRVMMIKKKHRGLYKSMMKNRRRRMNEAKNLERKRKDWDDKNVPIKSKKSKIEV